MTYSVPCNRLGRTVSLRLLGAVAAMTLLPADMALAEPDTGKPTVQVIDPMSVSPLFTIAPWVADGPAAHRRVVTHSGNGSVHLDIGYNTYKKGVRLSKPYAYTTDEVCLIPSGRLRINDDGKPMEFGPNRLVWRPAGAATQWVEFLEDTVTICAMAPARLDANSHRVPAQDVGKWTGDPAAKPYLHWIEVSKGPVITPMDKSASPGVVERELLSKRKDGSATLSNVYTTFKAGAYIAMGSAGEQICWVENGTLRLTTDGASQTVATRSFFYRPEGTKIDRIEAISAATMNCWSGPAAF